MNDSNTLIQEHLDAISLFFDAYGADLQRLALHIAHTFENGNKLLLCGNGGSSCDAMHIAGEFVGRFVNDRKALPAIALPSDSGIITAVGNDYGFEYVFSRHVEALGKKGDTLIALSTSGSSPNIIKAIETAKNRKITTVLFTGEKAREKNNLAEYLFIVPSSSTARIQEVHITALHILTSMVEGAIQ